MTHSEESLKYAGIILLALCIGCSQAADPGPATVPTAPKALPSNAHAAAIIYRASVASIPVYGTDVGTSPQQLNEGLRKALAQSKPGDLIQLGVGSYECGKDAILKIPDVTIRGM